MVAVSCSNPKTVEQVHCRRVHDPYLLYGKVLTRYFYYNVPNNQKETTKCAGLFITEVQKEKRPQWLASGLQVSRVGLLELAHEL